MAINRMIKMFFPSRGDGPAGSGSPEDDPTRSKANVNDRSASSDGEKQLVAKHDGSSVDSLFVLTTI